MYVAVYALPIFDNESGEFPAIVTVGSVIRSLGEVKVNVIKSFTFAQEELPVVVLVISIGLSVAAPE